MICRPPRHTFNLEQIGYCLCFLASIESTIFSTKFVGLFCWTYLKKLTIFFRLTETRDLCKERYFNDFTFDLLTRVTLHQRVTSSCSSVIWVVLFFALLAKSLHDLALAPAGSDFFSLKSSVGSCRIQEMEIQSFCHIFILWSSQGILLQFVFVCNKTVH